MSTPPAKLRRPAITAFATIGCWLSLAGFFAAGCGAPGEPVAPSPPFAAPINDLSAHQAGDGVLVGFTLPTKSVTATRLTTTPAVEILRGSPNPDGSPDLKSLRVVDTVPGSLAEKYITEGKFQFLDPISPDIAKAHPGSILIYSVRTRLSPKRASANSNIVSLRAFSVPERISSIEIKVTESAIELAWAAVTRTSAGDPLSVPPTYNIYRAELDDATAATAKADATQLNLGAKLQLLASQPDHAYSDKTFEFGKAYAYVVRSVRAVDSTRLESSDSAPAVVTPKDVFPPATPQSLSSAILPGEAAGSSVVELSWSINVEPDFAGYRVYRRDQSDTNGQLLTPELLPTPAYRDTSVQSAHRYWYTVTAVDRAGNESPPSPPLAVEILQPSP